MKTKTKAQIIELLDASIDRELALQADLALAKTDLALAESRHESIITGIESWVRSSFANAIANTIVNSIADIQLTEKQQATLISYGVMEGYTIVDSLRSTVEIEKMLALRPARRTFVISSTEALEERQKEE